MRVFVELDYSDTDITDVTVLDYIASSERTRISRSPAGVPEKTVAIEFDGWVFPRSGVAFVWNETMPLKWEAGARRSDYR